MKNVGLYLILAALALAPSVTQATTYPGDDYNLPLGYESKSGAISHALTMTAVEVAMGECENRGYTRRSDWDDAVFDIDGKGNPITQVYIGYEKPDFYPPDSLKAAPLIMIATILVDDVQSTAVSCGLVCVNTNTNVGYTADSAPEGSFAYAYRTSDDTFDVPSASGETAEPLRIVKRVKGYIGCALPGNTACASWFLAGPAGVIPGLACIAGVTAACLILAFGIGIWD